MIDCDVMTEMDFLELFMEFVVETFYINYLIWKYHWNNEAMNKQAQKNKHKDNKFNNKVA